MEDQSTILKELREQRQMLMELSQAVKKIERASRWGFVMNMLRLVIILIPLILAVLYLPPLVERLLETISPAEMTDRLRLPAEIDIDRLRDLFER